ncbi:MAG: hypothetical protein DRQ01_09160 [Ignavibacteriae bacterium]|nr:MAG: hypothetical protein DRQ01_09160 [Ignavibacteriota bacterium]
MIKIVVANMFDFPSRFLLIGSNFRGHCEKPTSLVSQVLPYFDSESLADYDRRTKEVQKLGTGWTYRLKEGSPFSLVHVGYPGTGHQPSFEKMLFGFFTDVDTICLRGGDSDITMPLVGTSFGDLSLEDWAESFNRVAKDYIELNTYTWIDTVTIVCTSQERKEFIDKKIYPSCFTT